MPEVIVKVQIDVISKPGQPIEFLGMKDSYWKVIEALINAWKENE